MKTNEKCLVDVERDCAVNMGKGSINTGAPKDYAFDIASHLIKDRQLYGNRMGLNDDLCNTNLISKNYSPMFIRKYNIVNGWPIYVSGIIDESISDLDHVVNSVIRSCKDAGMFKNDIQNMRNLTGILSETLIQYYNNKKENCVEGIGILLAIDKCMISNLYGDYMNHAMCRSEFYSILNMMPHI
ncbi:MAG: hypothetical protein ACTSWK_00425 [Promethearchaeota archaeon]